MTINLLVKFLIKTLIYVRVKRELNLYIIIIDTNNIRN